MSKKEQKNEIPQPNRDKLLEAGYEDFLVMPEIIMRVRIEDL